jgi:polar amino acid transport system substrate-binding protein
MAVFKWLPTLYPGLPERAEKYNYSLPLSKSATSVAVKPDLKVKTLYDLAGKTTEVLPGVQVATMLETWNKAS